MFGREDVRRLEAAAGKFKLGYGAKDSPFEFDHGGIVRTGSAFVAKPFEGGAEDGDEPRGRICHDIYGDAERFAEVMPSFGIDVDPT